MDKEERKLGTPYLQDTKVIDLLAQFWAGTFYDMKEADLFNWYNYHYNNIISYYRREIDEDNWRIAKLTLPKDNETEHQEINDKKFTDKFSYIKDLANNFMLSLKYYKGSIINGEGRVIEFESFGSDIATYTKAICELDRVILGYDTVQRLMINNVITKNGKEAKETKSGNNVITESDLNEIPSEKYKTLVKYFSPKENFNALDKEEKIKVLKYLTCAPTKNGRGGITRDLIETLRNYFKENHCFLYNQYDKKLGKGEKAKILSNIFCNSSIGVIKKYI